MGKRDYRNREAKKPKKESKKPAPSAIASPPAPEPEVVGKRRPPREES